jgi:hypothetical protein
MMRAEMDDTSLPERGGPAQTWYRIPLKTYVALQAAGWPPEKLDISGMVTQGFVNGTYLVASPWPGLTIGSVVTELNRRPALRGERLAFHSHGTFREALLELWHLSVLEGDDAPAAVLAMRAMQEL